jgi:ribosomal protein S8
MDLQSPVGSNMSRNIFSGLAGVSKMCHGAQMQSSMPHTKHNIGLCQFLFRHKWISGYFFDGTKSIQITYSHLENENTLGRVIIRSSPGNRNYCTYKKLLQLCSKQRRHSYYVLYTSRGISSSDEALSHGIGGELLMQILY